MAKTTHWTDKRTAKAAQATAAAALADRITAATSSQAVTTKYKLTRKDCTAYNGFQLTPGEWVESDGIGKLCGRGWIHYYHSPRLAVLLAPLHVGKAYTRLWEVETDGEHRDDRGLKGGCTRLRLVREIELPAYTPEQRVKFAILCAREVYPAPQWSAWAERWLSGEDRSAAAAEDAAAASWTAPWAAAWCSHAATWLANAERAHAAAWVAHAAAYAAAAATTPLDLDALAQEALR